MIVSSPRSQQQEQSNPEKRSASLSTSSKTLLIPILIIVTCIKVLLIPSYYSTDFHVHRNWLSITYHLPLSQWYYNDINGTTVHTLDYPPSFAYFEYILSNNVFTKQLLTSGLLDEECLDLLGDDDNTTPSFACIVFQRCTVILTDVIYLIGAYVASSSAIATILSSTKQRHRQQHKEQTLVIVIFLLIVCNPGMILLDHVHFQYNAMLLGILLLSTGFLLRQQYLLSAISYSLLLTMKHLYLPLALLYFIYLLRWYCCLDDQTTSSSNNNKRIVTTNISFSIQKFVSLGLITVCSLLLPFLPFLFLQYNNSSDKQIEQIVKRLFPFERGLCHDYWAGNIWSVYLFLDKCISFVFKKNILPDISPLMSSCLLFISLFPGLAIAWKGIRFKKDGGTVLNDSAHSKIKLIFLHVMVYSSFSSFMLAYHVHEKAIMTTIIPLTLLIPLSKQHAQLYLRTCAFGIFGLFPLLFRVVELPFKIVIYFVFLFILIYILESEDMFGYKKILTIVDKVAFTVLCGVMIFMEVMHPLFIYPKMEFLPLMITSITVAIGLIFCWIHSGILMFQFCNSDYDGDRSCSSDEDDKKLK